tara:strand:+ start:158 stop:709 length:552 start_codon:yes stop_codon:yes gene_type:complete
MWTYPNMLTVLRLILVPCFVISYYIPWGYGHFLATAFFLLAIVTDWLDGFLARKYKQETRFGAFLDPVADKLMISVALIVITQTYPHFWIVIPVSLIIGREILISALREWMAHAGVSAKVIVSSLGKWKTGFQMSSVITLILADGLNRFILVYLGVVLLYVAALLTLWSMIQYFMEASEDLTR